MQLSADQIRIRPGGWSFALFPVCSRQLLQDGVCIRNCRNDPRMTIVFVPSCLNRFTFGRKFGEKSYSMPDEIRFHLNLKLFLRLLAFPKQVAVEVISPSPIIVSFFVSYRNFHNRQAFIRSSRAGSGAFCSWGVFRLLDGSRLDLLRCFGLETKHEPFPAIVIF